MRVVSLWVVEVGGRPAVVRWVFGARGRAGRGVGVEGLVGHGPAAELDDELDHGLVVAGVIGENFVVFGLFVADVADLSAMCAA